MVSLIPTVAKYMLAHFARFEYPILKWLLAALLIAIPVYPKFPLFNFPGIYVAVRAEDFLLVLLGFFLSAKVLRDPKQFFSNGINQALFLFFAVGLVSLLSGIFVTHTVVPHVGLLHWIRRIEYALPFFAGALLLIGKREGLVKHLNLNFFVQILVLVSIVVFVYAIGQINWGFPVISTQNYEYAKGLALRWIPGARLHSTFAGHYDLAAFVVITLPLFWAFLFASKKIADKVFISIGIATSFWLLIAASSRISIAAYFVGVGAVLWFLNKRLLIVPIFAVSIILMFMMGDLSQRYKQSFESVAGKIPVVRELMIFFYHKSEGFLVAPAYAQSENFVAPKRRWASTPEPKGPMIIEDRSTSIRLNAEWPRAVRSLFKNPLLGTGYSSITLATDSDYLRLLGEVGALGFFSFMLVIVRIWKKLWNFVSSSDRKITDEKAFVVGSIGVFLAILVNATFIDIFEASKVALVFWAIMGISVAVATHQSKIKI